MQKRFLKAHKIITILSRLYTAKGMVDFGNPEDTLLATLLSARTTDEQVLKAYPGFRRAFPDWETLTDADERVIASTINTIGLFRNKAKAIKALAKMILEKFHGRVPDTMEELIQLPGVGRKTASCVLGYSFKKPAVAVDTHVFRIAHRLGWAKGKTPERVEEEIKSVVAEDEWRVVNRVFVQFGRDVCKASKPQCWRCPVRELCPYTPKTREGS